MARSINISHTDYQKVLKYSREILVKQQQKNSRDQQRNDTGNYRFQQCVVGKLGEVGAAKLVKGTVDFNVWTSGRGASQFEPDIQNPQAGFQDFQIHVKTCNLQHGRQVGRKFLPSPSSSWTIDINDPVYRRPSPTDILMLMFASDSGIVYVYGWVYAAQVQALWRACRSPHMAHKRALYLSEVTPLVKGPGGNM
jgi:hypothetical protein